MQYAETKNGFVDLDHPIDEGPTVRSKIEEAKCASEQCVSERPVVSTLVAFGAGTFIGLVAASTMYRRESKRRENFLSAISTQIASSIGHSLPEPLNWKR
jgi:hypothetical protein